MPPLSISASPTTTTYGTTPLVALTANNLVDLGRWRSPTGDGFSTRIGPTTNLLPINQEHNARIILQDVKHPTVENLSANAGYSNVTGNLTRPSGGSVWAGGYFGYSMDMVVAGDCSIELTAAQVNKTVGIALDFGGGVVDPTNAACAFAVVLTNTGFLNVWSFGSQHDIGTAVPYAVDDVIEVAIDSGFIKCYKNGVVFYTFIPTSLAYPVFGMVSSFHLGGSANNILWWRGDQAGKQAALTLLVHGSLPVQPNWNYDYTHDIDTKMSLAEDRSPSFSEKTDIYENIKLTWSDLETEERDLVVAFWEAHKKSSFWTWIHPDFDTEKRFRFDSGLSEVPGNANTFTLSATITQNKEWGIVVDSVAPTVAITAPTPSQSIPPGLFTFKSIADDNEAVASVQFQIDGVNVGSPVTDEPYELSFDITVLAEGAHTVRAIARDFAGNSTYSTGVAFTRLASDEPLGP